MELPANFSYLRALTDDTGLLQFGFHGIPDLRAGYTSDDNARALIAVTMHYQLTGEPADVDLARKYLAFLRFMQRQDGTFHNCLTAQRTHQDEAPSEDCFGRCVWALGTVVSSELPRDIRMAALQMLDWSLPTIWKLKHTRSKAFVVLGLEEASRNEPRFRELFAGFSRWFGLGLVEAYKRSSSSDWHWFEDCLTYANGLLCDALFRAYSVTEESEFLAVATEALCFLNQTCTRDGHVSLVGNRGWFPRNGTRALFDQQPIDAMWLCWANITGWQVTGRTDFRQMAIASAEWFLGRNDVGLPLYDCDTGACCDGLEPGGVNQNRGAESTVCALLTIMRMKWCKLPLGSIESYSRYVRD